MKTLLPKNIPADSIRRSSQRGAALVELAFVMVLMLLIGAGTVEFGRSFWYADALTKATRDGARLMSTWPVASINSGGVDAVHPKDVARVVSDVGVFLSVNADVLGFGCHS